MYTVGARTATVDAFTQTPAVQTFTGQPVPAAQLVSSPRVVRPAARPATLRSTAARPAYRPAPVAKEDVVYREDDRSERSWQKTAMIIGGSTAGGAGIGGILGGKKGALIGAAIGGGASSIYEASRRR
jgi:hypothetical protein